MASRSPRMTHLLDQLGATLQELAPVLYGYSRSLEGAGFSHADAIELTANLQQSMITLAKLPEPDDRDPA